MAESLNESVSNSKHFAEDEALGRFLRNDGIQPTEEQNHRCSSSLSILSRTLLGDSLTSDSDDPPHACTSSSRGVHLVFAPIGAYALGCWDASATISCSMAGTPSEGTFFDMALQRLRRNPDIVLLSIDRSGFVMFQVSIKGTTFSIQYHQSPFTATWAKFGTKGLEESVSLAPGAKRRFNAYRDTLYMRSLVPDRKAFNLAYLAIKLWALRHGIFSEPFGYLDEPMLLSMVAEASCHLELTSAKSPVQIVLRFFDYFGSQDLTAFVIGDIVPRAEKSKARSQFGQGMVVCSYHSPCYNLSNVKTTVYTQIIQNEIASAKALLRNEWDWEALFGKENQNIYLRGAMDLPFSINKPVGYIKIEAAYWGISNVGRGRYFNSIVAIVAEFARKLALKSAHGPFVRPWPTRLQKERDADMGTPGLHHSGFYLIGLHVSPQGLTNDQASHASFKTLEATLKEDVANLEAATNNTSILGNFSFFAVSIVPEDRLEEEDYIQDYCSSGPIPVDEAELDELEDHSPTPEDQGGVKPKVGRAKNSKERRGRDMTAQEGMTSRSPLRPALDVLNRLRFDDMYAVDDYVVGYEDRHTGIMEMPVTSWKTSDNTLEDFIPQSRIVYFKRRSDGIEVWNRRTRLDAIFGSGSDKRNNG